MSEQTRDLLSAIFFAFFTVINAVAYILNAIAGNDGLIVTTFLAMLICVCGAVFFWNEWDTARNNEKIDQHIHNLEKGFVVDKTKLENWQLDLLDAMLRNEGRKRGDDDDQE